jgi:hypothetical protein
MPAASICKRKTVLLPKYNTAAQLSSEEFPSEPHLFKKPNATEIKTYRFFLKFAAESTSSNGMTGAEPVHCS